MKRRDLLRYLSWLTGSAVSASVTGALLSGCSDSPNNLAPTDSAFSNTTLHFFSPDQFKTLTALADTILPATDSPSASEMAVPERIDQMIGLVFDEAYRADFKRQWLELEAQLGQAGFSNLSPEARVESLRRLELDPSVGSAGARQAFVELKQQTIAYYLTSEEIGKNFLNYLPIPGQYEPCIPVDSVNNTAWAPI